MSHSFTPPAKQGASRGQHPQYVIDAILEALQGVKYGSVTVSIQDGHVIQIDRLESHRLKPRQSD